MRDRGGDHGRALWPVPDLTLIGATDLLGLVATVLIGWLLIFDFPAGAGREIVAFLALIGAVTIAAGAGDYRPLRGASRFPRVPYPRLCRDVLFLSTERRWNRTIQEWGYHPLPVLKTGGGDGQNRIGMRDDPPVFRGALQSALQSDQEAAT